MPDGQRACKAQRKKTGESHRIQIDGDTGAAKEGALQFIESPFAPGEQVTFQGSVTWYGAAESRDQVRDSLLRAFRWTGSFGAGRTIGFGRLARVEIDGEVPVENNESAVVTAGDHAASLYTMSIEILDPFCLARKRIDENLFSSDEQIPGSVVRGVLATTLNRLLGRQSSEPIVHGDGAGTEWAEIVDHLNEIQLSHSFPAANGSDRPAVAPLSLVLDHAKQLWDVALYDGPVLIDGAAPSFSVDWKEDDAKHARTQFPWPDVKKTIRTRTAIDRESKRAETGRLFSYEMIEPEGLAWIGSADFSGIDPAVRPRVVDAFQRIFAMKPAALGKTKARLCIRLIPDAAGAPEVSGTDASKLWVVTLQTAALLCDPARLDEASGRNDLFAVYKSAWDGLSGEALKLVRFFASQSLTGGYLSHRFGNHRTYAPFLLTDPGSVFVLEGTAAGATLLADWTRSRLPLPKWARTNIGESWQENPYLPCDGFGEIAVDLKCHTSNRPSSASAIGQWQVFDATRASARAVSDPPASHQSRKVAHVREDLTVGTVKTATFSSRWRFAGRIETTSDFHLGSGEVTTREKVPVKKSEPRADISAVAVDQRGAAYIPGSSLKGALRSWTRDRFDESLVNAVFGGDSDKPDTHAGKAEFHDAFFAEETGSFAGLPHWCAKRHTSVTASVAIDRWTRTAEDKKLFHFEVVPPGVSFQLAITAHDLSDEEAGMLLQTLRAFGQDGPSLGAGTRDGFGRFSWSHEAVSRLTDPSAWRGEWDALPPLDQPDCDQFAAAVQRTVAGNAITIAVDIAFDGPFLVNEPSRTKEDRDDERDLPNHAPRVGKNGGVVLPVSSFRGALRAQAEKIVRTLEGKACHSTDPEDACDAIEGKEGWKNLCLTCQLFGATGWASPISFSPFRLKEEPKPFHQELVAIDRFTGGVSGSAKFNVEAKWAPAFSGSLSIEQSRLEEPAIGLLALALRDLAEGDLPLGFGASKGYGSCAATVVWQQDIGASVAAFQAAFPSKQGKVSTAAPAANSVRAAGKVTSATSQQKPVEKDRSPFHNPYHFVPVVRTSRADDLPIADLEARKSHVTHDRYVSGTYSGRLLCRLTAETPVVIGAKQHDRDNQPKLVEPFVDPSTGKPAIAATSLRGLLSSVAEAASNSALRVLNDSHYSTRREMYDSLGAIGMIVTTPAGFGLRPLALPPLLHGHVPVEFRTMFVQPLLKVYVNGYRKTSDRPPQVALVPGTFLTKSRPVSYSADHQQFWYLDLGGADASLDSNTWRVFGDLNEKPAGWVLGLRPKREPAEPIDAETYNRLPPAEQTRYTRGILRVLGIDGREKEMPTTKKHEIFIPYPVSEGELRIGAIFDATEAVAEFHRLADMRTDPKDKLKLPFELNGSQREKDGKLRLREGDLVFFRPTESGDAVRHVAISSIWRREVTGTARQFFEHISPDLVPFTLKRKNLTIAEQLFGFVADSDGETPKETPTKPKRLINALAGRLRCSAAFLDKLPPGSANALLDPVALKILSSPKPPSPALYFRRGSGPGYVSKQELNVNGFIPQGRKFYLHHPGSAGVSPASAVVRASTAGGTPAIPGTPLGFEPWRSFSSDHPDQKNEVTPIAPKCEFWFHIDFDNLSPRELGLLCYATRPNEQFRHKLGMGKPLGLGTVKIDPIGLFFVDRVARYSDQWGDSPRYHEHWSADMPESDWPERYAHIRQALTDERVKAAGTSHRFENLRSGFESVMDRDIHRALELLGDPAKVSSPVHTPQVADAPDPETETYKWFVENEEKKIKHQYLEPLSASSTALPVLYGLSIDARPGDNPQPQKHRGSTSGRRSPDREPRAERPEPVLKAVPPPPVVEQTWQAVLTYEAGQNMIVARKSGGQSLAIATAAFDGFDSLKKRIEESNGKLESTVTVRPREKSQRFVIAKVH